MARTVIITNVAANSRVNNVLANTRFQFADDPDDQGAVAVQIAVTSDVIANQFEVAADKDFISLEQAVPSVDPAKLNENPGIAFLVTVGTQLNVDVINNNGAAQDFHTTVETSPGPG